MALQVLLVEPDVAVAEDIRRAFGPAGFEVTALGAGDAAVEHCRARSPDVILLSAELPDMSGFSVCNRLKRTLQSVPLVLYTGEATDAAIEAHRATRTHADDYLRKPFDLADLLGRVAAVMHAAPPKPSPAPPPAAPRPDGRRPEPEDGGTPPMLQRASSGQVAARGLAAALAAATAPPAEPKASTGDAPAAKPERPAAKQPAPTAAPPPVPPTRPQATLARVAVKANGTRDPADVFAEWPRDPSPPKGTPEEKLEYFRERLRARDGFLGKVRDALAELRGVIDRKSVV